MLQYGQHHKQRHVTSRQSPALYTPALDVSKTTKTNVKDTGFTERRLHFIQTSHHSRNAAFIGIDFDGFNLCTRATTGCGMRELVQTYGEKLSKTNVTG